MDVASLVRSINSSFEDATVLVKRIRDQKLGQLDSTALNEVIESLELGPVVVNGYYNADAKRFGDYYTSGDSVAREQLKDVLIHLQMTVLTTLRTVLVDDNPLDYNSIQCASDDCRVNTGVSLGQLSQRLVDPEKAQQQPSHLTSFPFCVAIPPLKHSGSVSSQSTEGPNTPTTPEIEAMMEEFDYPGRLPGFNPHASNLRGKAFAVLSGPSTRSPTRRSVARSTGSTDSWGVRREESGEIDFHRTSASHSSIHDRPGVSPISPMSTTAWNHDSPVAPVTRNTYEHVHQRQPIENFVRERFGPDDYSDIQNHVPHTHIARRPVGGQRPSTQDSMVPRPSHDVQFPYRAQHGSQASIPPLKTYPNSDVAHRASLTSRSSMSVNAPIPVTPDDPTPPVPIRSNARSINSEAESLQSAGRRMLADANPSIDGFAGESVLPTEKNLMGYCKGAQRLQSGSEKKAFAEAQRPIGFSGLIPYWKCEKCHFEGPMKQKLSSVKKTKPEKIFDLAVREYDGIRFRWAFLAKCHVPLKNQSNRTDGTYGSFGCIFCTAEAKNRHWSIQHPVEEDKRKNSSTIVPSDSTPIFGNSSSFMEHLQMHRQQDYWPNRDMQRRMKCIVGRVAEVNEDFEINFMPIDPA